MADTMNLVLGESRVVTRSEPEAGALPPGWTVRQRGEYAAMCAEYDAHGLLGSGNVTAWLLRRPPSTFADVVRRELVRPELQGASS